MSQGFASIFFVFFGAPFGGDDLANVLNGSRAVYLCQAGERRRGTVELPVRLAAGRYA